MAERCNGRDPAYPGLKCYLDKGHEKHFVEDCEFTDERGEQWRQIALDWMNLYYRKVYGVEKNFR